MSNLIKAIFRRKPKVEAEPLQIDGIKTRLTPRPDEAELAAEALLDTMTGNTATDAAADAPLPKDNHTITYYEALVKRIQANREREERMSQRVIVYCEEQLAKATTDKHLPFDLERELFTVQATVEKMQGELFSRWQYCLAKITMAQMKASEELGGSSEELKPEATPETVPSE